MFYGLDKLIGLRLINCNCKSIRYSFLEKLQSFEIVENHIYFNLESLKRFNNLKRFRIQRNLENLDFLQYSSLSKLEYLNLNRCKIEKIKEKDFSKLKDLKYLNISGIKFDFRSNIFLGLDNLETLVIKRNLLDDDKKVPLKKGAFNGLGKLKALDLSLNKIEYIEPEVFIHTPMLSHLRICGINCKLDENTFSHLKHLKVVESDLNNIDLNDTRN